MRFSSILFFLLLGYHSVQAQTPYFSPVASGTNKALYAVSFGSATTGYAVGADTTIVKTTDGGLTWTQIPFSAGSTQRHATDFVDVFFVSEKVGYLVNSFYAAPSFSGSLYKTTNGGLTWTLELNSALVAAKAFFFSEGNGYAIGSGFFAGYVVERSTAGVWNPNAYFNSSPNDFLYGIDFYNPSYGIVSGTRGYVYRTLNGGQNWDTVKTVTDSTITAVKFLTASHLIATTTREVAPLIVSLDSGRTWNYDVPTQTFYYPRLYDVELSARDSFVAVGSKKVPDGGVLMWYKAGFPVVQEVSQPLYSVAMRDKNVAFAVGGEGLIVSNLKSLGVALAPDSKGGSKVFPNPGSHALYVEGPLPALTVITTISGQEVVRTKEYPVLTENLASGVYVVACYDKSGRVLCREKWEKQ